MRFSGKNTELCTLKRRSATLNAYNEEVNDWDSNDTPVYAEFWEKHGTEGVVEGQEITQKDVRCKIRYVAGMNERDYRLQRGNVIYDVVSVLEIDRRRGHLLKLKHRGHQEVDTLQLEDGTDLLTPAEDLIEL